MILELPPTRVRRRQQHAQHAAAARPLDVATVEGVGSLR